MTSLSAVSLDTPDTPVLASELTQFLEIVNSHKKIESEVTPEMATGRIANAVTALLHSDRPQNQFRVDKKRTTATLAILSERTFTELREALGYVDFQDESADEGEILAESPSRPTKVKPKEKILAISPSNPVDYNALGAVLTSISCDAILFKKLRQQLMTIYRINLKEFAATAGGIRFIDKIVEIGDIQRSDITILVYEYIPLFAASEQGAWIIDHMIDRNFLGIEHKGTLLGLLRKLRGTTSGKAVIAKMIEKGICTQKEAGMQWAA